MKIKKDELLLLILSTIITLVVAILLIRWLQPTLLGKSDDLVLVSSSKKLAPYYETIFNKQDFNAQEFILKDPVVIKRARQLFPDMLGIGPNDLLGFRNESVPNTADMIIIGDSQTYGNNAHMRENWPHYLQEKLPVGYSIYSMATGGWGAIQYYYAATKASIFNPKLIVVAFYTGNDPLETFTVAYGSKTWSMFKSDKNLNKKNIPKVNFPAPENEQWSVEFSDGIKTVFTPQLRNAANMKHPAVDAGYRSMLLVAQEIVAITSQQGIRCIFTIIPTKELVLSKKVKNEKWNNVPQAYWDLIDNEQQRIEWFSAQLKSLKKAEYIDVISKLSNIAASNNVALYPTGINGHPIAKGYNVIADALSSALSETLPAYEYHGYYAALTDANLPVLVYIENAQYWFVELDEVTLASVQAKKFKAVNMRDLQSLQYSGHRKMMLQEQ